MNKHIKEMTYIMLIAWRKVQTHKPILKNKIYYGSNNNCVIRVKNINSQTVNVVQIYSFK